MSLREVDETAFPEASGFMQSRFWARFKAEYGWVPHYFVADGERGEASRSEPSRELPLLTLSRRLAPGFTITYAPHGPEAGVIDSDADHPGGLASIAATVADTLEPRPVFVRFDLPMEAPTSLASGTGRPVQGLARAPVDVQPPNTVLIDLTSEEDDILAAMKSKTRYNVRLAAKKGVVVREGGVGPEAPPASGSETGTDDLDRWYALYRETAERDRIAIHSPAYYRSLFDTARGFSGVECSLLVAEHDGELLSGVIILRYGETATYLYGASSNRKRNVMAPYALQWEAMRRARSAGARSYDLFGIPPADDPSHPMHGLYRFKTGFGGRIVHRLGGWDYPASPARYTLYRGAERVRTWYYKRLKKR